MIAHVYPCLRKKKKNNTMYEKKVITFCLRLFFAHIECTCVYTWDRCETTVKAKL